MKKEDHLGCKYCSIDFSIFDVELYFDDLSDLLCIIHAGNYAALYCLLGKIGYARTVQ